MRSPAKTSALFVALLVVGAGLYACSSSGADPGAVTPSGASAGGSGGASGGGGDAGSAGSAGSIGIDAGTEPPPAVDPTTCAEAAESHSYVGCDFWPTVLDNIVRPDFDYAVIAANAGDADAEVTVERGDQVFGTVTVAPGSLVKMYLPWVPELKGVDSISPGCPTNAKTASVYAKQGAYHVKSTRPVTLYQFNALEYEGKGGPAGKSWSTCETDTCFFQLTGKCFSYTNDASLLLPSTALSGTYRIAGSPGWKSPEEPNPDNPSAPPSSFAYPPYFSVTATQDGTSVSVKLSATGAISGAGDLPSVGPGGTANFVLGKGDVALIVGKDETSDFSGSLVTASAPVQVMTGISCTNMPSDRTACDHLEETVLPAETLGKRYFVTAPSGPDGKSMGHVVRLYGNVDGTQLTYPGANPGGPSTLDAGQFIELQGVFDDFEVTGDHEFTVASFQVGAGEIGNQKAKGDPAQSFAVTVEQYRQKYVFLAPDDYEESYADVVQPLDAQLMLDGEAVSVAPVELSSGYGVVRLKLGPGKSGAHVLTASKPVGLQVMGYGAYTSYQYPGGLNLGFISSPPIK